MTVKNIRMILKACAEDTRLRILNILHGRELTVKIICQALKVNQSVISKHLSKLRMLKMVVDKRIGNLVYYRLTSKKDTFQYNVILFLKKECSGLPQLDADKKLLLSLLKE